MGCSEAFLLIASICILAFSSVNSSAESQPLIPLSCKQLPVDIVGISVTPHVYSQEMRWRRPPSEELGSLLRLFISHRDTSEQALELELAFNGKGPSELLADGDWNWYDMPENRQETGYTLEPGKLDVFTFNAGRSEWGMGSAFKLTITDGKTRISEEFHVPIKPNDIQITSIVCLASEENTIYPDTLVIHIANNTDESAQIKRFRIYKSESGGMREVASTDKFDAFTDNGIVLPNDRSGAIFHVGRLPLTHGVVEMVVEHPSGKKSSLWAYLRFKRDQFDIGAGWLDVPSSPGVVPLTKESFLKLLKRMHINLAHIENVPGYTDSIHEYGLYTRYPLRMMSGFADVEKYNTDEWVAKIHGVDALGEPQMGKSPEESYKTLRKYDSARYPTTITLSEESGFRYYAGLSDYPHFDAYRVTAPAADYWWLYDRWEDGRLLWGAPLETIGEMTRTLRSLSRPVPIAIWSQGAHYNWQGSYSRRRSTPTPDEILMQAYQGLANGITGLYWYSLEAWSLLRFRDTIDITTRIGREIRLLEDLYMTGDAYLHERITSDGKPDLDLSSIIAPDAALLFALGLDYEPDRRDEVFRSKGTRDLKASYKLPGYLRSIVDVFRIDGEGIYDVKWSATASGVIIEDTLDRVAVYVVTTRQGMRDQLSKRLDILLAAEAAVGFDPASNDDDFTTLLNDLGFGSIDSVKHPSESRDALRDSTRETNPITLAIHPAVVEELHLTSEQEYQLRRIRETYQLELMSKMQEIYADQQQDLSPDQRRERWSLYRRMRNELEKELRSDYVSEIGQILQPGQFEHLNQIAWQLAGIAALQDERVMEALGITSEQQDKLSAIEQDYERKSMALYRNREGDWREKLRKLREEQDKEVMQVLSDEQNEKFGVLKGVTF